MSRAINTIIAATIFFVLIAIFASSFPLDKNLIGNNIDSFIFYWNDWWLATALKNGQNPLHTDYIFAPTGTSLIAHSNAFFNSALVIILQKWFSHVYARNLVLLFGLWVGALGMFLLVNLHKPKFYGGLLAGFAFSFAPYHITRLAAQDHLSSIHWWPWFAIAFIHSLQSNKYRYPILAGLFAAFTFYSGLQLAVMLGLWAAIYFIWMGFSGGLTKQSVLNMLIASGVSALLCLPLLLPIFKNISALQSATIEFGEGAIKQTDILAWFIPPKYNPFIGAQTKPFFTAFGTNHAFIPYLGIVPLVFTIYAIVRVKKMGAWSLGLLTWAALALGSSLRINGQLFDAPLPFKLVGDLFPVSAIRSPDRFNLLIVFTVAFLAGHGLDRALSKVTATYTKLLLFILIGSFSLLEFSIWPFPSIPLPASSPFYDTLAQSTERDIVYDYPPGYTDSKTWLYYQTIHQKPVVEGHVSRYDASTYAFILNTPLLRAFYDNVGTPQNLNLSSLESTEYQQSLENRTESVAILRDNNVRYIIHHLSKSTTKQEEALYQAFPEAPIYKDDVIEVFDLDNLQAFEITPAFFEAQSDARYGELFSLSQYEWQASGSSLSIKTNWLAHQEIKTSFKMFVHLLDASGNLVRQHDTKPCEWQCPTESLVDGAEFWSSAEIDLHGLPAGNYQLSIGFYNEATGERLAVGASDSFKLMPQLSIDR